VVVVVVLVVDAVAPPSSSRISAPADAVPSVYALPASTARSTDSVGSRNLSSSTVTTIVTLATPAARVTAVPCLFRVPPITDTL